MIGGNRETIDFKVFAVEPDAISSNFIWYEFGVVPNLHLEVVVGADVFAPYRCSLLYLKNKMKRLQFEIQVCPRCLQYRIDHEVRSQMQLRFVNRRLIRKRNRLKVG